MSDAPLTNGHSTTATVPLSLNNDPLLKDIAYHSDNSNGAHEESPTTPVSNNLIASDVKIDMDIQEPESDVRHEPLPTAIKIDKLDHASVRPEIGTPMDPGA